MWICRDDVRWNYACNCRPATGRGISLWRLCSQMSEYSPSAICHFGLPPAVFHVEVRHPGVVALRCVGAQQYLAIRDKQITTDAAGGRFCDLIIKEIGECWSVYICTCTCVCVVEHNPVVLILKVRSVVSGVSICARYTHPLNIEQCFMYIERIIPVGIGWVRLANATSGSVAHWVRASD